MRHKRAEANKEIAGQPSYDSIYEKLNMLSRTTLPLSRALPTATRLIIVRSSGPMAIRALHISSIQNHNSKASFATVAPEKQESLDSNIPSPLAKEEKSVVKPDTNALSTEMQDLRDHHWNHPVYTRAEYEAIQVVYPLCEKLTPRSDIMKLVR